jgi:hypothetical protein
VLLAATRAGVPLLVARVRRAGLLVSERAPERVFRRAWRVSIGRGGGVVAVAREHRDDAGIGPSGGPVRRQRARVSVVRDTRRDRGYGRRSERGARRRGWGGRRWRDGSGRRWRDRGRRCLRNGGRWGGVVRARRSHDDTRGQDRRSPSVMHGGRLLVARG